MCTGSGSVQEKRAILQHRETRARCMSKPNVLGSLCLHMLSPHSSCQIRTWTLVLDNIVPNQILHNRLFISTTMALVLATNKLHHMKIKMHAGIQIYRHYSYVCTKKILPLWWFNGNSLTAQCCWLLCCFETLWGVWANAGWFSNLIRHYYNTR